MAKRTQYWREYFQRNKERILARQRQKRRERGAKPRPVRLTKWTYAKKLMAEGVPRRRALFLSELAERQQHLHDKGDQSHD